MNGAKPINRNTLAILAVALAVVLFAAVNIVSSTVFKAARLDLTEDGLFTVSDGTGEVMKGIDEPIALKFYYSPDLSVISGAHGNYAARVRELLEHYVSLSGGMLELSILNPEPYSLAEDQAVAYGLQGVPLTQAGDLAYFGLAAINSTDDKEVIPFFEPSREPFLEYELTRLIFNLANPKKKVIGLLSTLPMDADPVNRYQPWVVLKQMRQFFEVRTISGAKTEIADDVDVLMVVHPKDLSEKTLYAVDQFVLKGGKAMVFVDPHSEAMAAAMAMRRQPGASDSNLTKLFDAWGVGFTTDKFVGDLGTAVRVNAPSEGRTVVADYVAWLALGPSHMNRDDVATADMRRIHLAGAGFLEAKEGATTELTPLLSSSQRAMRIDADAIRMQPDPVSLFRSFKSEGRSFTLAARVRGQVKSAFPDGPPKGEAKEEDPKKEEEAATAPHLAESAGPVNLVVVADTDILSDRFWLQTQDFFGQRVVVPTANNGDFVINVLDNLTGSDGLISLRSRGLSLRPFHRLDALKRAAELKYSRTRQELQEKLGATEKKLGELQSKRESGVSIILTEEQKATVKNFRTELLRIRQQLRDVQHALRKDIDALDTWLKVVNIWAMPVLISIVALVMAVFRQRRHRRRVISA